MFCNIPGGLPFARDVGNSYLGSKVPMKRKVRTREKLCTISPKTLRNPTMSHLKILTWWRNCHANWQAYERGAAAGPKVQELCNAGRAALNSGIDRIHASNQALAFNYEIWRLE